MITNISYGEMKRHSSLAQTSQVTPASMAHTIYIIDNISIRHRWESEMGSSQHKSPQQARAFRRVLVW